MVSDDPNAIWGLSLESFGVLDLICLNKMVGEDTEEKLTKWRWGEPGQTNRRALEAQNGEFNILVGPKIRKPVKIGCAENGNPHRLLVQKRSGIYARSLCHVQNRVKPLRLQVQTLPDPKPDFFQGL